VSTFSKFTRRTHRSGYRKLSILIILPKNLVKSELNLNSFYYSATFNFSKIKISFARFNFPKNLIERISPLRLNFHVFSIFEYFRRTFTMASDRKIAAEFAKRFLAIDPSKLEEESKVIYDDIIDLLLEKKFPMEKVKEMEEQGNAFIEKALAAGKAGGVDECVLKSLASKIHYASVSTDYAGAIARIASEGLSKIFGMGNVGFDVTHHIAEDDHRQSGFQFHSFVTGFGVGISLMALLASLSPSRKRPHFLVTAIAGGIAGSVAVDAYKDVLEAIKQCAEKHPKS
jgi:hypothetical protein